VKETVNLSCWVWKLIETN